ncbi:hypothetical protein [Nocardia wallacei]|uniref:Uncharacterized protein n=1 Tax=Nocardia wallacei TaxID=480035 RepID=A0A7G1KIJ4_9NOCA|nr:hypothetical protein [Nocardia wallacei]BCK54995.1 hypothetical protein NWFMUON74_27670 [Nocardia wallacei]
MTSDPIPLRTRQLTMRATRAGYHLIRAPWQPHDWVLLDAQHGDPIFAAPTLDHIERWLAS